MRKVFVAFAACLLVAAPAAADAPAYMPVQGVLADAGGTPVNGDVAIRFGLYTADLGGTEVWNETQTVTVDQGFFTAYLGDVTVLNLAVFRDNNGLWLGVRVGSDAEMSRFQVATTGYAAYAQYAGDAEMLGGTPAGDFLTSTSGVGWGSLTGVPAGFADGTDDGASYSAGTGLTLTGSTFAADQTTIQGWAQGVCYDTEAELTAALDDNYSPLAHSHPWSSLTGVPAGFADGTDDVGPTYTAGAGLSLAGTTLSVSGVTSAMITDGTIASADIADGTITAADIGWPAPATLQLAPQANVATCGTTIGGTYWGSTVSATDVYIGVLWYDETAATGLGADYPRARLTLSCRGNGTFELVTGCSTVLATITCTSGARPWTRASAEFAPATGDWNLRVRASSGTIEWQAPSVVLY
ncbi:MAG: hypothetical protein HY907_08590 [Deltaproteobacteria bacterium]|nr:hypothetical protein [Deltaproteobacteria bacterium]